MDGVVVYKLYECYEDKKILINVYTDMREALQERREYNKAAYFEKNDKHRGFVLEKSKLE